MQESNNKVFNPKNTKAKRRYLRNNMTEAEIKLWSALKGRTLCNKKFRRQHGIGKYVVDFYCPEVKLAVEVDGESHYHQHGRKHDERRTEFLNSLDIKVVRFTNDQILYELDGVLIVLEKELTSLTKYNQPPLTPP